MRDRPSANDPLRAFIALGAVGACALGLGLALVGIWHATHGGGPAAKVVALVGVVYLLSGAALAVLAAGGRRG